MESTLPDRVQAPPARPSPAPAAPAGDPRRETGPGAADELLAAIVERRARIGVIGLGAVGLPLARAFVEAGFRVQGHDRDAERVAQLERGENPLHHLPSGMVRTLAASGRFEACGERARLAELDVALVCVPTPLDERREPDLACVREAARALARGMRRGTLVVLESTTWPGTTRSLLGGVFREEGWVPGEDVFLAYSPEREDPGRATASTATIPKLVGGTCERSQLLAEALYRAAIREVHAVSSAEVAEAAKLFENVFRAVNIGLVNEFKLVLERLGLDVWETLDAAGTKPFGFLRFTPGPGTGGQCIPVDPQYYSWIARQVGARARLVDVADEINRSMPAHVIERTRVALRARGGELVGARVLLLGVAYKPDVDIVAESPALEVLRQFDAAGAQVHYADPHVPRMELDGVLHAARALDARELADAAAVVLLTDHAAFDYALVARHARLVVDTRHALASRGLAHANVVGA